MPLNDLIDALLAIAGDRHELGVVTEDPVVGVPVVPVEGFVVLLNDAPNRVLSVRVRHGIEREADLERSVPLERSIARRAAARTSYVDRRARRGGRTVGSVSVAVAGARIVVRQVRVAVRAVVVRIRRVGVVRREREAEGEYDGVVEPVAVEPGMEVAVMEVPVEVVGEVSAGEATRGERCAEVRTPERTASEPTPVRPGESAGEAAPAVCHTERVCRAAGDGERQANHEEKDGEPLEHEDQRPLDCRELHGGSVIPPPDFVNGYCS